ncbi:methyltransferase domain-containing protein [Streptomyces sp. NPDC047017]|uniref:methyltransferase domain-containing protein n=1 Tax=Streptomyces sp. NPDC047017 TaxID=3155024 RepID=UPI0033F85BF2
MIQIVEHAPREGPYAIVRALEATGLPVRVCRVWAGDRVPDTVDDMVGLVVADGPTAADEEFSKHSAALVLLRAALEADVPVLGVCLGAHLLAIAGGGHAVRPGAGARLGCDDVRTAPAAQADPLFAAVSELLPGAHRHGGTVDLPPGATLLVGCESHSALAFRIGDSAWGIRFPLENVVAVEEVGVVAAALVGGRSEGAVGVLGAGRSAPVRDAVPSPVLDGVSERFAALVVARAEQTATRAFFTRRAAGWEERFAADGPRYTAATERMGLRPGLRVLDVGCGTGRVLPALRAQVGDDGVVLGADLTPAMLAAAVREGRERDGQLLLADACRLPLPDGAMDAVFSAGLVNHVPDPAAALREWARVTVPDGVLLLFHPSGRAERAARHGRPLDPDDPLAEEHLRPALRAAGWRLAHYEDATHHFLARAVRLGD